MLILHKLHFFQAGAVNGNAGSPGKPVPPPREPPRPPPAPRNINNNSTAEPSKEPTKQQLDSIKKYQVSLNKYNIHGDILFEYSYFPFKSLQIHFH